MKANICFYCKKACGDCSWSAIDPVTKEPLFEPIPGWTAEPAVQRNGKTPVNTYHITACPEFDPDDDYKLKCKVCGAPLRIGSGRISYCEKCAPPGDKYHTASNALQRKLKGKMK